MLIRIYIFRKNSLHEWCTCPREHHVSTACMTAKCFSPAQWHAWSGSEANIYYLICFSAHCQTGPPWGAVILIVRNPLDTVVADWNRVQGHSHVAAVGADHFGKPSCTCILCNFMYISNSYCGLLNQKHCAILIEHMHKLAVSYQSFCSHA